MDTSRSITDMSTECKRVTNFDVIDSGSNLSDRLPLHTGIHFSCNIDLVEMSNREFYGLIRTIPDGAVKFINET